jgi:hypothetical protein
MAEPTVPEQIEALLAAEGPLTMSKIATKLARNPGGIRGRLLRMTATGRVIATKGPGPNHWLLYSLPDERRPKG